MSEKIEHEIITDTDWEGGRHYVLHLGLGPREVPLLDRYYEVPHHCTDPACPGDINRRKLEAYEAIKSMHPRYCLAKRDIASQGTEGIFEASGILITMLHRVFDAIAAAEAAK